MYSPRPTRASDGSRRLRWLACSITVAVLIGLLMPHISRASTSLDTSGCGAATLDLGTVLAGSVGETPSACTIQFGSTAGTAQIVVYQQDGVSPAMSGIDDYASGATDWSTGASTFGACLQSVGASISASWGIDSAHSCATNDATPWNALAATSTDPGAPVATTTSTTTSSISLRFGARTAAVQSAGAYTAPLVIDVYQVGGFAPSMITAPVITGTATAGQALSTTNGTWANSPTGYTYQWRRCNSAGSSCTDIAGATAASYTLSAADVDQTIRVVVTASNSSGSTPSTPATQTAVIAGVAPSAGTASITGTATLDQVLTAQSAGWSPGTPAATMSYQWRQCDAAGSSCTDIAAATASTYTLVTADVGHTIRVVESESNTCSTGCGAVNATSGQTAVVAAPPVPNLLGGANTSAPAFAPSITLNAPTGLAAGDLLILQVGTRAFYDPVTPPAGFTEIGQTVNGSNIEVWSFYKIATGSEPASYTASINASGIVWGGIAGFANVNTASPIMTWTGATGTTTTMTAPSITLTGPALVLSLFNCTDRPPITTPAGTTEVFFGASSANQLGMFAEPFYSAGATGTFVSVDNGPGGSCNNAEQTIALTPA